MGSIGNGLNRKWNQSEMGSIRNRLLKPKSGESEMDSVASNRKTEMVFFTTPCYDFRRTGKECHRMCFRVPSHRWRKIEGSADANRFSQLKTTASRVSGSKWLHFIRVYSSCERVAATAGCRNLAPGVSATCGAMREGYALGHLDGTPVIYSL
jgi:hypothetical protein